MSTIPEGSIVITPVQVYDEVKSLTEAVRKLVAQDEAERGQVNRLELELRTLDTRVSAIEKKMLLLTGAAAAAGAGVGTWLPRLLSGN